MHENNKIKYKRIKKDCYHREADCTFRSLTAHTSTHAETDTLRTGLFSAIMSLAVRRTLGFWVLWLIGSEPTSSDGNGLVLRLKKAKSLQSDYDNNGHAFITHNKAEQSQVDFVSFGCSSCFK